MQISTNTSRWYDRPWAAFIFFTRLPFWRLHQPPKEAYTSVVEFWPLTHHSFGCHSGAFIAHRRTSRRRVSRFLRWFWWWRNQSHTHSRHHERLAYWHFRRSVAHLLFCLIIFMHVCSWPVICFCRGICCRPIL